MGDPRRAFPADVASTARNAPTELRVTAESEDGVVMAVEHAELPLAAVQFHPESILSLAGDLGLRLVRNVVACLEKPASDGRPPLG